MQVIFNMLKKLIVFLCIISPFSLFANDCVKYKQTPKISVLSPLYSTKVVQPDEPMDKYHGNVVATFVEDYDISVDIFYDTDGYCVALKSVDALVGYNDFLIKIDNSNIKNSCSYNAILNHEYKHIDAYLSVMNDLGPDVKSSIFNAANSVMPVFALTRDDIDYVIEKMNYEMRDHPELILIKQKINAAQEIRNKRIDQNEDNHELKSCLIN